MSETPVKPMTPEPLKEALTGADDRPLEPLDAAPGRNSAAAAHRPACRRSSSSIGELHMIAILQDTARQ